MVLVINAKRSIAESLVTSFSYMGILAYAVQPSAAHREINPRYRAAIVFSPEELPDEKEFISRLRALDPALPVFAVTGAECSSCFSEVFAVGTSASIIAERIFEYMTYRDLVPLGEYRLAGLDLSPSMGEAKYFFTTLPLTRTESMIVRFLIRAYPSRSSVHDILKYVFRPSKRPEPSSVRTHISAINRKFRERFGRHLIAAGTGEGYILLTPETMEARYPEVHAVK